MSIRARLSLWYALVMFLSLLSMGVLTYRQFAPEPFHPNRSIVPSPREPDNDESDLREALRTLLWCGVPALVLALAGGWWMMHEALAPVAALTRAAERLNEHNLGERLPCSGARDELDRLTAVFNAMTARLENSFARVREFTLHASHELKTPLTVIHNELETALQEEDLSDGQRARLESELDEVQRLTKIVDGLTLLTKADAGQVKLVLEPVGLDELVREACDDAQSLARTHCIAVTLAACEPVTATGDRHRLRQLLLNLTDNAIKYNQPGGSVAFSLVRAGEQAVVTITNTGAGLAPEHLPRVFDRFYRADASHSSEVEGCGLGLSIAQWIVQAHQGTIQIASKVGGLTTVKVSLPLRPPGWRNWSLPVSGGVVG